MRIFFQNLTKHQDKSTPFWGGADVRTLIVIPTYNEVECLPLLIDAVLKVTPSEVHLLVVDDGSPDGTGQLADQIAKKDSRVYVLHRAKKMGLGTAYIHGFEWGIQNGYDCFIEMDADFSHNPKYLTTQLELLKTHDVVIGSRYVQGGGTVNWGILRKIISRGGSLYSRFILGAPIRDFTGGFNGWRRHVLESVNLPTLRSDGYSFQIELKYRAFLKRFKITEFPIIFEDRKVGKSKMSSRIVFEALARVWQFRWKRQRSEAFLPMLFMMLVPLLFFGTNVEAKVSQNTTAILVDKKTNLLHVAEYENGEYKILQTFHTTLGKVKGDKEDENDLKTPEGIYQFTTLLKPPHLRAKFGVMAFLMNYPNSFDRLAGRTGKDIMLHATNDPERLKQNYDSEGCVVVKNEELEQIKPHIKIGMTPILVFSDLTPEYLHPGQDAVLKEFFESWIRDWESKNLDGYIDHYHSDFTAQEKNKVAWKEYKKHLNSIYSQIEIQPTNVRYYRHPKYSMITFTQNYRSRLKSGGWGHRSTGTKILIIAEEAQKPRIIAETFSNLVW